MMRWRCLGKWATPLASILFFFIQIGTAVCGDLIASSEFRGNSYTSGTQYGASIAMDADGDFVIAWISDGQDGSMWGVYAQRYNAAGVPQGSEFQVNTYTTNSQWHPSVAMDADGDFVVAWDGVGQDSPVEGVYAQRYNAAGVPQGNEFYVGSHISVNYYPSVAMDADGDFVIAWQSSGPEDSGFGIYARRYNAAGVPQDSQFHVNTYTNGHQWSPFVAMDADGDFVIAWTSDGQDGSSLGVYAQRYDAAGVAQGGEFRVNTYTNGEQWCDSIVMDTNGNFVVAWISEGEDGYSQWVFAQRYDAAGVAQGSELQMNPNTSDDVRGVSVAIGANGAFMITWDGSDGFFADVYAQCYNSTGVPQGSEFRVNTYTNDNQWSSSVAMDADGDFVVAWDSEGQDGSGYGVYGRRYSKDSDTDGLPDWWEKQYFGGTTNAVAGVDNDNDRHNNLNEYLAGTDPTNQNSVFAITEISRAFDSDFLIKWYSVTNRFYALQKCSNLVTGGWDVVTNNIPATEPVNTVTVKVFGADASFYRVEVEQ